MNSSSVLSITTFVYGLAGFFYIFALVFRRPSVGKLATWFAILGLAGNTSGFLMRWVESYDMGYGHAPLSNLYESLIFFSWTIAFIYLFIEMKYRNRAIGAFSVPIAFLAMCYASLSPNISDQIQPLIPALKSNWLIAHVITCFIGYGAFAVAFGLSCMYLIKQKSPREKGALLNYLPAINVLEELNHQLVMFGFLFLSVGIITGAVWANSAWGRYWGWDPKETWSLITWFVYATLLHARLVRGWHGQRIAYLSIVGFAAVLFTYFGVNLLPGLHSYASMGQ
jgi:cytochrome c-type biogenesis protein CcsB